MVFDAAAAQATTDKISIRAFWKRAILFTLIGVALYLVLLVVAEMRVRATGERNPLFQIATAAPEDTDLVIFGASHAMPLGFEGIGTLLEERSGRNVMVLAIEGGGVVPNALMMDALLHTAQPQTIIYALDTFAFLSPQWNEERLNDSELYARAPLKSMILRALISEPAAWHNIPGYLFGFDKVNNILGSTVDRSEAELTKFERTYRSNDRIDDQRVAYLFPDTPAELMQGYINRFDAMAATAKASGSEFAILLMPAPPRYTTRLPETHAAVLEKVRSIAEARGLCVIDHTKLMQGDENYYDTDHLNRTGAQGYVEQALANTLRSTATPGETCLKVSN